MGTRRTDPRPAWRRRLVRGAGSGVLVVALLGGAWFVYDAAPSGPGKVTVRVTAPGVDAAAVVLDADDSVGEALVRAGVRPHDGRLLSVRDGTVIDEHADPARITVDGVSATAEFPVADGARITVVDGSDRIEGTAVVEEVVPAAPFPDQVRHVYHEGRDGLVERIVGEHSGEVLDSTVVREPIDPTPTERHVVALTFDDGPNPTWTPAVLLLLGKLGVKATFCQLGEHVAAYPDLTRLVAAAGHQLCNHTISHPNLAGAPAETLDAEIGGGADAITDLGLDPPRYYRAPGGSIDDAVIARAEAEGEVVLGWSIDARDWADDANAARVVNQIVAEVEPGSVILLHDGGGETRQHTMVATVFLIEALRQRGYEFSFPLLDPAT